MNTLKTFFALLFLSHSAFGARIAIYNDSGVWGPSRRNVIRLLKKVGHTAVIITPEEIKNGDLTLANFDAIVIPGGKSWVYLDNLGAEGAEKIRAFVSSGGGYMGFCAGAFAALSERRGGVVTGPYGLGLIPGVSIDAYRLGIPGFADGMKPIHFKMKNFKDVYQVSFLESPLLDVSPETLASINGIVVARYEYENLPAVIFSEYGRGKVFISGPHMEVNEARVRDPDSEWPMLMLWIEAVLGGKIPEMREPVEQVPGYFLMPAASSFDLEKHTV